MPKDVLKGKQAGNFSIQKLKWFGGKTDSLILFWIMTGLIVGGVANISNTETGIRNPSFQILELSSHLLFWELLLLQSLQELGTGMNLYALVFGKSVLNDAEQRLYLEVLLHLLLYMVQQLPFQSNWTQKQFEKTLNKWMEEHLQIETVEIEAQVAA